MTFLIYFTNQQVSIKFHTYIQLFLINDKFNNAFFHFFTNCLLLFFLNTNFEIDLIIIYISILILLLLLNNVISNWKNNINKSHFSSMYITILDHVILDI